MHRSKSWSSLTLFVMAGLLAWAMPATAEVTWPSGQLLPSFSAPSSVQDLIILRGQNQRWEAEGAGIGHNTGRLESDGWLCQVGVDKPSNHMVYGPYDRTVPAGANTAEFRMKTDNNTANDDAIVSVDVVDNTAGQILAAKTITRKMFPVVGEYTTFSLPFILPGDNHSLELRVFWMGGGYTKVDWVGVTRSKADDEMVLFASLKGIVNAKQPRIFSYEGDAFAEGQYTWLQSLGLGWNEVSNNWDLIAKYRSELAGLIVYDNAQPDTLNLATTIAGSKKALLVSPGLVSRLTAAPYNLPILVDFRGKFSDKLSVYQTLYNEYWPGLTHRLAFGLNPTAVRAAVREYATAVGAASLWLDPSVPAESALLNQFLSSMGAGSTWMGWWPEEGAGVAAGSKYGIATVASDWATNLTLHGGMPRKINLKPMPTKPGLQNKLYVAFILSDGDNLQYVEHLMRKLWNNPDRGRVPMGWTLSPAMVDAMPGALNYYWTTSTTNDCLLSGPSGYGYTYPNLWNSPSQLDQFVARTEDYNQRAGFRVITVWNTITGGVNTNVGNSFADNAPTLLGLTAQNTGGGLTIYNNKLPGMALSCNYCTGEQAMKDFINSAASGWNRNEPRFIIIQAQPWTNVTPTSFLNVANSLSGDYAVVRPDHIFQLLREAKGLPVNPSGSATKPAFMIVNKNSGKALDLIGGNTSNGARINQWNYDYNGANQQWNLVPTENGNHFKIISVVSGKSACIDMDSMNDGAQLHAWDYTGNNPGQQWDLIDAGSGWYKIKNVKSGKMLDVDGFSTADDAKVQQWVDNGGQGNQLWRLQPRGDYYIKADSGKYVCIQACGSINGGRIIQYDFEANPWFKWRFENVGDGWSKVSSLNALSKVISVNAASTAPGAYLHLWEYNATNGGDQKVRIVPQLDGKYKFTFAHDGQTWDVPGGQSMNDVEIDQYPNNGNKWQEFSLEVVK